MSIYNFSVQLTVQPANGQHEISAAVEAEKVAAFVKRVGELADSFGTGETRVEILPAK